MRKVGWISDQWHTLHMPVLCIPWYQGGYAVPTKQRVGICYIPAYIPWTTPLVVDHCLNAVKTLPDIASIRS